MRKLNLDTLLLYLIAFLVVISSRSTYLYITNSTTIYAMMAYGVIPIMLISIATYKKAKIIINKSQLSVAFAMLFLLSIYCIFSQTTFVYSLLLILTVITIYLYCCAKEQMSSPDLLDVVCNIIFGLALISLVLWLLGSIMHLLPYTYIKANWGSSGNNSNENILKSYFLLQFENDQTYLFGKLFTCNKSIFIERGFASFNFSIALYYEMLIKRKGKLWKTIILLLAVITTFSTAGFITLTVFIVGYYLVNSRDNLFSEIFKFISMPLVVALSYIFINYVIETKMGYMHSFSSRNQDFINGFEVWKQRPLFGFGYANTRIISDFHTGYSNSVSALLTQGGLALFIPYFSAFVVGIAKGIKNHNANRTLFVIMLLINVIFSNVPFLNITIYLVFYVGMYTNNPAYAGEMEGEY